MSWINDVRAEMKALDTSKKSLRKFGLTVGFIFVLLALWFYIKGTHLSLVYTLGPLGAFLVTGGALLPGGLRALYRVWMGFAFAMGWIVSRVILSILFFFVIFPVGLIARLVGKEFIDISLKKKKDSYWIKKEPSRTSTYEKMY